MFKYMCVTTLVLVLFAHPRPQVFVVGNRLRPPAPSFPLYAGMSASRRMITPTTRLWSSQGEATLPQLHMHLKEECQKN